MYLTPDDLKKLAAISVAAMNTDGTPLNESLASIALDNDMNSDQVKRLVETTNQLAYLSELASQDDRSFEFTVANYDTIMDSILGPVGLDKEASATYSNPMDIVSAKFSVLEKVASNDDATLEKWGRNQKLQALQRVTSQQRSILNELESSDYDNMVKLAQHRAMICRDPEALEKMAKFSNGKMLSQVVFGHTKVASEVRKVWRQDDLKDIQALSDRLALCKQAQVDRNALRTKVEEAEGIIKAAFVAAAANAAKAAMRGKASIASTSKIPIIGKVKKAYGTFDAIDSTNEVRKGTNKRYDAWSSLRG